RRALPAGPRSLEELSEELFLTQPELGEIGALEILGQEGPRQAILLVEPVAEVDLLAARGAEGARRMVVGDLELLATDGTADEHDLSLRGEPGESNVGCDGGDGGPGRDRVALMDLSTFDKAVLRDALLAHLEERLAVVRAAQKAAHEGATHEESRPEGIKDMRSTETSYLARGQAERVVELTEALAQVRGFPLRAFAEDAPIGLSALVQLENEAGAVSSYFMAPAGGGIQLESPAGPLTIVTPRSPLGRALVGRRVGDEV